ncbi:DUF805 domain-containing protein [Maritimibacter sp. UBA3975]|uniref:DUF805 domain-containing protein n=1 Tax=Maritimibacter sp. UBA3975 TaxID=1946833 RepID=UPI000C099096|nr:DUF805 domain-containing protein [Maritimibacter sp. UBA3975]MAM62119.1 DUF805 domain-containing protein [Maritimibacter sp.]|tara:strand:- start:11070 stop:11522 length:453 start_codon:yes stop_codon:yes gene_type:complete
MNMMDAVKTVFSKYATFSGRARRAEFWWFVLFYFIANIILSIIDSFLFGTTTTTENGFSASTDTPILSGIFWLATIIPYLAVSVRRLHDTNRVGWWLFIGLIPLVGIIVLIVFFATGGDKGGNRFGADPIDGSGGDGGGDAYEPTSVPRV